MQFDLSKSIIVGQGLTSIQTAEYLLGQNKSFQIYSFKENALPEHLAQYYTNQLGHYTMAWLSPGIPKDYPCMRDIDMDRAWLDIDYFLYHNSKPVILVTGTNGKSTVVRMLEMLLASQGLKARCYGNYQPGLLKALDSDLDWVILELSSYQLDRMRFSGKIAASVLLNISVDHINWHGSFHAYRLAKLKILSLSNLTIGVGGRYSFLERAFSLAKQGYSFVEALNLGASLEVMDQLGFKVETLPVLPKLPYRQSMYKKDRQLIVNDSKSTNLASTISAIQVFREKYPLDELLLILAGIEKDNQYCALTKILTPNIKIIVIGESFQGLSSHLYRRYRCIEDAMSCIMTHEGIVLFSPGGASYDQYGSYEERGKDFDRCLFNIGKS